MQAYTDIIAPTILGRKLRQSQDKEMNVSTKQNKKPNYIVSIYLPIQQTPQNEDY
jgi:hypothetical protein